MEIIRPYTIMDLLDDVNFISHVKHPSPESESYWTDLVNTGKIQRDDYELSVYCIRSFRIPDRQLTQEEIADLWTKIRANATKEKKTKHINIILWTVVAMAACALALTGIFIFHRQTAEPPAPVVQTLKIEDVARPDSIGTDIQIIFSENERLTLTEKTADIKYTKEGNPEVNAKAVAQTDNETSKPQPFNQVIVPQGRHSSLTLSDGTKLWLNASSRVVYPPVFEGKTREIFLEGEAYLEVAHDENLPFVVKTKQMEIKVLGTKFNISAYDDEEVHTVVLAAGSVTVRAKTTTAKPTTLTPNQLFQLDGEKISVRKVNVKNYISWIDGIYIFKEDELSFILKRLAHYYGIEIEYAPEVGKIRYNGKIDLKEDPLRVLSGLSHTAPVICRKENGRYYLIINY